MIESARAQDLVKISQEEKKKDKVRQKERSPLSYRFLPIFFGQAIFQNACLLFFKYFMGDYYHVGPGKRQSRRRHHPFLFLSCGVLHHYNSNISNHVNLVGTYHLSFFSPPFSGIHSLTIVVARLHICSCMECS